jgi:hypothetical protein
LVYTVYVNEKSVIDDWRPEPAATGDPAAPDGWRERFERQLWPTE